MCMEWRAWKSLLAAAPVVAAANALTPASQKFGRYPKTFTYDLVDIGREVLAQLTTPIAQVRLACVRKHALQLICCTICDFLV
jgi:hypothetical protein